MKTAHSIIATSLLLCFASSVNACTEDRLQVIGRNVYLMSKPSKDSNVILQIPENFDYVIGCITGNGSQSFKVDRVGNRWWYAGINLFDGNYNDRQINGWVMAKKVKVIQVCCQA
jgi:hypothetical protein